MSTDITNIENGIENTLNNVTEIKTIYKYPRAELIGELPILEILYNNFNQEHATARDKNQTYNFNCNIYFPFSATNPDKSWDKLKTIIPDILAALNQNQGLDNTCYISLAKSGQVFFDTRVNKSHIGHSFIIEARKECF